MEHTYQLYDVMFGSELLGCWDTMEEVQEAARAREEQTGGVWWPLLRKTGERKPIRGWTY